ncbi:MAG: hypothetical protein IIB77_02350 [Proteobacteria bacterium]|nr:hypothetical protein [Pseudomonadota bacterium]
MSVRAAKFVDIPRIAELGADAHKRSIYAQITTFDDVLAKQLCARSLQRHAQQNYGGTLFLVSETAGEVRGFIIALIDLVYPCFSGLVVTDLAFAFTENAEPRDAAKIILRVIRWAEANPKVIEVHLGVTDAIGGDWKRVGKLYERLGFEQCGGMFRKLMPQPREAQLEVLIATEVRANA